MFDAIDLVMPDDFHHHLRDGDVLKDVVSHAFINFQRIIAMPNIKPPVRNIDDAIAYHERYLIYIHYYINNKLTLIKHNKNNCCFA